LELGAAADDVAEVRVDRRLEQRRELEAVLDQQPPAAHRDIGRQRVRAAPLGVDLGRHGEDGHHSENSVGLHRCTCPQRNVVYSKLVGIQKLTPIWNITLLISDVSEFDLASSAEVNIVSERLLGSK